MRRKATWPTLMIARLLLGVLLASSAEAAKPLTSKAQLENSATDIVMGRVQAILTSTERIAQFDVSTYVAEIVIEKVEKGISLTPGTLVYARYWSKAWRGAGPAPPDDYGHAPTPRKGDLIRVYLVHEGYNGAGETKDKGYDVYFKNGFEILGPAPR